MIKAKSVMMDICKFIAILLFYCACAVHCYPARPLNERSPELTWQAWLLVDDQNQNKQQTNSDGVLRRRITPKSVFIAPTFRPEQLPPCADGYSSDTMGRCIKIIKLDEDRHYNFLVEKLKEKFGPLDYDDEGEEDVLTPGPFQVNIPLEVDDEDSEEDTDIAIIVSPTKSFFDKGGVFVDKRDGITDENNQEMFLKKLSESTTKKALDDTTVTEELTTISDSTTLTDNLTPVTEPLVTTEQDVVSTESHNTKRSTVEAAASTTEDLPLPTTLPSTEEVVTVSPILETSTPNIIRFPEEPKGRLSFIKFPDSEVSFQTQIPSSVDLTPSTSRHFPLADSPAKVVFRDPAQLEVANLDYSNGVQASTTTRSIFDRRNRDKQNGMYLLPPRWSQPSFQKPLVLRFSRKHAYLDENQFKHPDYYRAVPTDDFAYLFKFKQKQLSHR